MADPKKGGDAPRPLQEESILARVVGAGDSLGAGNLRAFPNEDAGAAQASERRTFGRELLAMDDIVFADLDVAAHIQGEIE